MKLYFIFLLSTISLMGDLIQIKDAILDVEIADNVAKRSLGLKYRKTLGEDCGMLFVFPKAEILSFWMQDTLIDLSIGFFDDEQKLVQIEDMQAKQNQSLKIYQSKRSARYAIEVNKGWFDSHNIHLGDRFTELTY